MPPPVVAIHRSFSQHFGREILDTRGRSLNQLTVRTADAHVIDLQILVCCRISEDELAESLNARLALDTNDRSVVSHTAAVCFETHRFIEAFEHNRLLRKVSCGRRRGRRLRPKRCAKSIEK